MDCKKILLIVLPMCWALNAYSAAITKTFPVLTQINKNDFFSEEVTKFEFQPSSLLLTYDSDAGTFNDEHTDLIVETDIPKTNSDISLAIKMTDSDSLCKDFDGLPMDDSTNLVSVFLEENKMEIDEAVDLEFNDEVDDKKASKYDTRLSFDTLPQGALDCSGSVTMMLEFSI